MSYKIVTTPKFDKNLKQLFKKYHSIKNDVFELGKNIIANPTQGDLLFENCYKVRMAISSKNKGKSGGARIFTYIYVASETVYLLSIYDKSEQETMNEANIKSLIESIIIETKL